MKRIMILSSSFTGHGHQSIAQAVCERLEEYPDVLYEVVDGFSLIGKAGINMSKMYGSITRKAKDLWKVSYALLDQHPDALMRPLAVAIHDRFLRRLDAFDPDMILTVHPFFNGSVMDILDYYGIDIPFYALQADLINIHASWCDPRATLTLCPSQEAYDCSIHRGMPPEKLRLCGFPTRAQFCDVAKGRAPSLYTGDRPIRCLLMSGGEGSGNLQKYTERLLGQTNCELSVICGRNEKLKEALEWEFLPRYGGRLTVRGFVEDVASVMAASDLVIARGSPNTLMEAVVLAVPLIITGCLPGQEADNPAMMVSHNLGVICESADALPSVVKALTGDSGRRLREIQAAQMAYRNLDNAADIARVLYEAPPKKPSAGRRRNLLLFSGQKPVSRHPQRKRGLD